MTTQSTTTPPRRPRKARLKSLDDLRRYMAHVIHMLDAGEIGDADAKTRAYLISTMTPIIRDADLSTLADRIEKLEADRA